MIHLHLDIVDRHLGSPALSCVTGWIAADAGHRVQSLGLRVNETTWVQCRYPFFRGDVQDPLLPADAAGSVGFSVLLPEHMAFGPDRLNFAALVRRGDSEASAYSVSVGPQPGRTQSFPLAPDSRLEPAPVLTDLAGADISPLVESRLLERLARERHLTLRLDLVNKCNLRCVMCHYSNESIALRPAQRITPEQFASYFDPIAPLTRDVVLSCGDEPLMSPHFGAILRHLTERDPEVRIVFCTNGMLLTGPVIEAIVAANVSLVMFSFDGVTSGTLHRIRVGSDYRRIIRNILALNRARARAGRSGMRFVFNYVMLESNIHEAPRFVALARRLGGDGVDFRHVVPSPEFYDIEHERLERFPEKYNFYREKIAAAAGSGMEIYIPSPLPCSSAHDSTSDPAVTLEEFDAVLRELGEEPAAAAERPPPASKASGDRSPHLGPQAPERVRETSHCFCERPFREVMIREQRDVYPCPWHQEKMGTLDGSDTLEQIFFGPNFQRVRLAMLDPLGAPGCRGCPIKADQLPTHALTNPTPSQQPSPTAAA